MRELKFRAWYKGDYIDGAETPAMMCDVVGFEKTSDHYDTFILDSHEYIGCGRLAVPRYRIRSEENNCLILQYSGLKDKNGKEIYEGDVLNSELTGLKYVIMWDDNAAFFIGTRKGSYLLPIDWKKSSIIGNIYDNPELQQG